MKVEIIYIDEKQKVFHHKLTFETSSSAKQALMQSTLFEKYPELSMDSLTIGIFSKKVNLDYQLKDGDRIEIYRPLTISPMEKRRLLAKNNNTSKK